MNQHQIDHNELNTDHSESQNLLFYDFNSGARQFHFRVGNNARLATRGEFRRTDMEGAKYIDHDVLQSNDLDNGIAKKRPTTSQFRCGDRLPSRASKTRDRAKRFNMSSKKQPKKKTHVKKNRSPQNNRMGIVNNNHRKERQTLHTAIPSKKNIMFEDINEEMNEYGGYPNYYLRKGMDKNIIIEEQENYEEDQEPSREVYALCI